MTLDHKSKEYVINLGLPQGSPLSPILFLVFAAPWIKEAKASMSKELDFDIFASVNDTDILTWSPS